jgi:hypothetical protein
LASRSSTSASTVGDRGEGRAERPHPPRELLRRRRLRPGALPGEASRRKRQHDRRGRDRRGQGREQEVALAGENADGQAGADQDHANDVGDAGQQKERNRAAGDLAGLHSAAPQRPRAERQAARAAGRQQRVGAELGHADLVADAPAHTSAEDHPKHGDIAEPGKQFQADAEQQPAWLGMRQTRAQSPQPGEQDHDRDDHENQRGHDRDARAEPPPAQLSRHRQIVASDLDHGGIAVHGRNRRSRARIRRGPLSPAPRPGR